MTQWAAVGVSVFEFRTATSEMIFQNSTPTFWPMSIEKSKFTTCSQVIRSKYLKPILEKPISLFSAPQILRAPFPCFQASERPGSLPAFA